ncbi:MAG: hypothetical protein VB118_07155 [Oscillospiraceae bacterium]|nr:hypothetical protein [Oscillospiraceae bacterium]
MNRTGSKGRVIIPGDRFERLVILNETTQHYNKRRFICRCDCGNTVTVYLSALTTGNTKSCGCYRDEKTRKRNAENKYHLGHFKNKECTDWTKNKACRDAVIKTFAEKGNEK